MIQTPPPRLRSVDAFRGLAMAAMIVVNNPGSWSHMHPILRHAGWGETPMLADLVFPAFLLLVGVSTTLALGRGLDAGAARGELMRRAASRAAVLFVIGLFLNLYPDFDLVTLRIPGVLQRIALVFLACAAAYATLGERSRTALAAALLLGYAALLRWAPVPGEGGPVLSPELSWPVWLDERLLGAHTWRGPGDPEGLLSTLPAIATGLIGTRIGDFLRAGGLRPGVVARMALAGFALMGVGFAWSRDLPFAKELWTPPYALASAGATLVTLVAMIAVADPEDRARWLAPLELLGRRALTAFVAAHLLSDTAIRVIRWSDGDGGTTSLHHTIKGALLDSWLPPEWASLVQSLLLLALITAGLAVRERRRNGSE